MDERYINKSRGTTAGHHWMSLLYLLQLCPTAGVITRVIGNKLTVDPTVEMVK